ncbi:MAG: hypothetical protein AAFQ34_12505 [Pseudomonadota bacterium]
MIGFFRLTVGTFLAALALLCFGVIVIANDEDSYRDSLEKSQRIHSDLEKVGVVSWEFYSVINRYPLEDELQQIAGDFEFRSLHFDLAEVGEVVWLRPPGEPCTYGSGDPNDNVALNELRVCMWRGEWSESYALRTGEHTLPMTLDDYRPSAWNTALFVILGSLFGIGSLLLLTNRLGPLDRHALS